MDSTEVAYGNILYPPDCLPLSPDLNPTALKHRLQRIGHELANIRKNQWRLYKPLAYLLSDDWILLNSESLIHDLVLWCHVQLLSMSSPALPYPPKTAMFILSLFVKCLKNGKNGNKYCNHIYKAVACHQLFNLFFQYEYEYDAVEEFCFSVIQSLISFHMKDPEILDKLFVETLKPFIQEMDFYIGVPERFLNIILKYLIKPQAYPHVAELMKNVIVACSCTLEGSIQQALVARLNMDPNVKGTIIEKEVFSLIYAIHEFCPDILLGVINSLENCLSGHDQEEKKKCCILLMMMISENGSSFATDYRRLWNALLIMLECNLLYMREVILQYAKNILVYHLELQPDFKKILQLVASDRDPLIQEEVIDVIAHAAEIKTSISKHEADILSIVRNKTTAEQFLVRKKALSSLSRLYCIYMDHFPELHSVTSWILNTVTETFIKEIVHTEDQSVIKYLLRTYIVPNDLPSELRMMMLLYFWGNLNAKSRTIIHQIGECDYQLQENTKMLLSLDEDSSEATGREWKLKCKLAQILGDECGYIKEINDLSSIFLEYPNFLNYMRLFVHEDTSCWKRNKIHTKIMNGIHKHHSHSLLPAIEAWIGRFLHMVIDGESMSVFLKLSRKYMEDKNLVDELKLDPNYADITVLGLLYEVMFVQPCLGFQEHVIHELMIMYNYNCKKYAIHVLKIFKVMQRYKRLGDIFPQLVKEELVPFWYTCILKGNSKEVKAAVHCLSGHVKDVEHIYRNLLMDLGKADNLEEESFITHIIALGHIAETSPFTVCNERETFVELRKLCESMLSDKEEERIQERRIWCTREQLPPRTLLKVEIIKTLVRFASTSLLGHVTSLFSMLSNMINSKGNENLSKLEEDWLRLSAGLGCLKLSYMNEYAACLTVTQFVDISSLMIDENKNVRILFIEKLCHYLVKARNGCILPASFFSYFILAGMYEDRLLNCKSSSKAIMCKTMRARRQHVFHQFVSQDVTERLPVDEFLTENQYLLPDWSISIAMSLLAHHEIFQPSSTTNFLHISSLINNFVNLILLCDDDFPKPNEMFLYGMLQATKNCVNSVDPDNDIINEKLWAACDMALLHVSGKISVSGCTLKKICLPDQHFKPMTIEGSDRRDYIPKDVHELLQPSRKRKTKHAVDTNHSEVLNLSESRRRKRIGISHSRSRTLDDPSSDNLDLED